MQQDGAQQKGGYQYRDKIINNQGLRQESSASFTILNNRSTFLGNRSQDINLQQKKVMTFFLNVAFADILIDDS